MWVQKLVQQSDILYNNVPRIADMLWGNKWGFQQGNELVFG